MRFTKMNGAGNDFILINNMVEGLDHSVFPALARTLCHRRLSIVCPVNQARTTRAISPLTSPWT